jgi:hypothetical protein
VQECHDEFEDKCHIEYNQQCWEEFEDKCHTEHRQECHDEWPPTSTR